MIASKCENLAFSSSNIKTIFMEDIDFLTELNLIFINFPMKFGNICRYKYTFYNLKKKEKISFNFSL